MTPATKTVTYTTTNSYSTLNTLTATTKNVWIVLHGIGYLSRYFLRHFESLPADENYIIAPQAPSKYYLDSSYTKIGASWLTKENTSQETSNVLTYLDTVRAAENIPESSQLIILGFSQGVSIATRWVANRRIDCTKLVLYAGGLPNELEASDFTSLIKQGMQVSIFVGDRDEYLTKERRKTEAGKIQKLFDGKARLISFDGKHEIKPHLLQGLVD